MVCAKLVNIMVLTLLKLADTKLFTHTKQRLSSAYFPPPDAQMMDLAPADPTAIAARTQRHIRYSHRSAAGARESSGTKPASSQMITASALCHMDIDDDCDGTCVYTVESKLVKCASYTDPLSHEVMCIMKGGQAAQPERDCRHIIDNPSSPSRTVIHPHNAMMRHLNLATAHMTIN